MFLSTALAVVVWSCKPASHMHSSIVNVPKTGGLLEGFFNCSQLFVFFCFLGFHGFKASFLTSGVGYKPFLKKDPFEKTKADILMQLYDFRAEVLRKNKQ